ncbi:MAG: carboxypeptidase-like regulatory domain-containing protein, partial [Pyrinomonadaceae bacterium]
TPVSGVPVSFNVVQGGGHFVDGPAVVQVQTDSDGYARARYVAGAAAGPQLVRADFAGHLFAPVAFSGEAFESSAGRPASVSGVVRDMNMRALPNVLVRVGGQQARTGADGRFLIENVAAGPHQLLELIGRDQITLPGRWPNISYDLDVLPGVENSLGRPLFLPRVNAGIELPLDAAGVVTQDTAYELPVEGGEPPVRVVARAGTRVTFPPDVTDRRLSVTRIPAGRVPMPLEDGRASNLYISVQPSGALFEPALEVSFPNIDRLAPATPVLLMSFDHDAGRYVQNGTGTVSADGRTVTSEPGSGIRVGAWHSTPPKPPQPEVTLLAQVQVADNPKLVGKHIEDVIANAYGTRGVVLTPRAAWHDSPMLNIRFRFNVPRENPPLVKADVETPVTTPAVKLEEVSFGDNYTLKDDLDTVEYESPHWKAAEPKGSPVAYTQGKTMKAGAKFSVAAEAVPNPQLKVRFDGNDNYDLDGVVAKFDNKKRTIELSSKSCKTPFAKDTIDYFEEMKLKWEVALDGQTYEEAGTSSNQLYVTLNKPSPAFHTVVHLATSKLKGVTKSQKEEIINRIYAEYTDRDVRRVKDDTVLKYWGAIVSVSPDPLPQEFFSTQGLLKNCDGRCGAWHFFLWDVLKVQGIDNAKPIELYPKVKSGYDPRKETNILIGPSLWTVDTNGDDCDVRLSGHNPAQGNPTPSTERFTNHAVVKIGDRIFDPSYGTQPFANQKAWEDANLYGTLYFKLKDGPNNTKLFTKCVIVKNDPAKEDLEERSSLAPPTPAPNPFPVP